MNLIESDDTCSMRHLPVKNLNCLMKTFKTKRENNVKRNINKGQGEGKGLGGNICNIRVR